MHKTDLEAFFVRSSKLMSADEIKQLRNTGLGGRVGFGHAPALVIIDVQNYMVGPVDENDQTEYPSACASARKALPVIARLVETFRSSGWPVFYTQNLARMDGRDMGVRFLKRGILNIEGWYLEGTKGAEIVREIAPTPEDIVLRKIKPSAFHGTPLVGLLISAGIDTVVIVGGSTSNCIRATVIDSVSYNFRTIVPDDAVFDRVRLSHEVSLMDIDRQLGDVMTSDEVIACVSALAPRAKRRG